MTFGPAACRIFPATVLGLSLASCSGSPSGSTVLTADMPLHLEEHLDAATTVGSEVPEDISEPVEWHFDEPQPDWIPYDLESGPGPVRLNFLPDLPRQQQDQGSQAVAVTQTDDALRVTVAEPTSIFGNGRPAFSGAIYTDLSDWNREDWASITIRARTTDPGASLLLFDDQELSLITDGTVQSYQWRPDWSANWQVWDKVWDKLVVQVVSGQPVSVDILSVTVTPKGTRYAEAPAGVRTEVRDRAYRRTLYTHAPGNVRYRVTVPAGGRLDVSLGVLRADVPVTFSVTAQPEGREAETLLQQTYADTEQWAQRTIDLSHLQGQMVTLALETEADRPGTVALWAAPTLSGSRVSDKPNVIFYVIDAGGADYMSVYGYNRSTTPNLERLAAEGAAFERAYSNSSWTGPSTASFMTSLQNSVLGGTKNAESYSHPLPDQVVTIPQHLHQSGYQTAAFVSNTYAGTVWGHDRGVDVLREAGVEPNSTSSQQLQRDFWRWREVYPGEPYWVHFQTTDVHWPYQPVAPFAGLFITPDMRDRYYEWARQLATAADRERPMGSYPLDAFEQTGISRVAFFDAARSLYDEAMAHNDYQIGRLVDRLKAAGEWEHTLLIIAADHGQPGAGPDFEQGIRDPVPSKLWPTNLRSSVTRVPLIVVWPDRIAPGQRFSDPVSMIDVLPTVLDLVDLPMPEVMQGASLAPLLLGEEGWEPRPVILDEFYVYGETDVLAGQIEVIDGRWGASLSINPFDGVPADSQPPLLLLYDLWNDPMAMHSLHEERPDLVEKYTEFLEAQWEAHQALAQLFTRSSGEVALTPEQLRTLRSLGYIR